MASGIIKTYTATGAQPPIDVNASHGVSFQVYSDTGDAVFTIEALIHKDGEYGAVTADTIAEATIKTFTGPLEMIRINISSLGTATDVTLEVLGSNR